MVSLPDRRAMSPVDWLLKGLAPLVGRQWGAECPAGAPVPARERCAAVDCDSVPLTSLAEGEWGRVTCLDDPGSSAARKLAVLGILPGVDLVLQQRTPVFIFRLGHAEFALDADLARRIRLRREPHPPRPVYR